jgi:hypothetical protein
MESDKDSFYYCFGDSPLHLLSNATKRSEAFIDNQSYKGGWLCEVIEQVGL